LPAPPATTDKPTCLARVAAELKRLLVLGVIAGLVAVAGKYYCFDKLDEEIRARVEKQLRDHYRGLDVSVKSARRVPGQGLEIRGVRIAESGGKKVPVLVEIGEILAECDTRLPDFLTRPPSFTALHVQRLKLRGERKASGLWNLAHLIPLPATDGKSPPAATISDASLEIVDPSADPACAFTLRNIELRVQPEVQQSRTVLHVRGTLAGDHLESVEIDGVLDPASGDWDLRGAVEALEFSPRLRAALPRELSAALAPLSSIRGRTKFVCHAQKTRGAGPTPGDPPILFTVNGSIAEGRIDDARLPEPLSDVEARIRIDNYGVQIEDLSARCGETQIELSASLAGFGSGPIDITEINVRQLTLERWPLASLPPQLRETWGRFSPRGIVDIAGRLHFDGQRWQPDLTLQCRGLSFLYDRFPYRLTDGAGTIGVKTDNLSAHLKMQGGGRTVCCDAVVQRPGPDFLGLIDIRTVGGIPIDDKLLAALEPAARRIVQSFEPRGSAQFWAHFERSPSDAQLHRHVTVELHDCTIRHERFTYPIDKVQGLLELIDNDWQFRDLVGRNDSAIIRGSGSWLNRGELGRQLVLDFQARDVPLADELQQALPPGVQRLWSNLRPRGNIDELKVRLTYTVPATAAGAGGNSGQWSIEVQADKPPLRAAEGRPISLEPAWFRYVLDDLRGGFHYKDGELWLTNLHAVHGQSNISAAGYCRIQPDGTCRLNLSSLNADQVLADNDLLSALPAGLSQSLSRFPLSGPLNLRGKLGLTVAPQPDIPPQLDWNLELDVANGRLATPTPLESLQGGLRLRGRQGREGLFCSGELQLDSAIVHGVQITNISGPFFLDGRKLVFGALAERDAQGRAPRQIAARLLGGTLSLGGDMALDEEGVFHVQATLDNADLAEIARHAAPQQRGVSGRVFAAASIGGTAQGKYTWRGDGQVRLRDADIYQLPLMIRLLSLLSVKPPDRTAFTTSDIDFLIEGDDLELTRIDFSGDAISLKGRGHITGQRQIDLKFHPVVGREESQWPFIRPLFGQTGRELLLIEVTGTLDRYDLRRTAFPRLDERLQALFPELVNQQPEEPSVPVISQPRQPLNPLNLLRQR
jgi:hypothetical protein